MAVLISAAPSLREIATTGEVETDVDSVDAGGCAGGRKLPVPVVRSPPDSGPVPLERGSVLIYLIRSFGVAAGEARFPLSQSYH